MRKSFRSLIVGAATLGLAACAPSPAEIAQQLEAAVNAKSTDAAVALLAPEAAEQLTPVVQDLVAKNTKLELVGQYKIEGAKVTALENLTNDEYTQLAVAPVEANLEATVVKGKVTALALSLTPEAQAKVDGAIAAAQKKVVEEFAAALNGKNIDAAMALVAEGATFNCGGKAMTAAADIKTHYEEMFAKNMSLTNGDVTATAGKVTAMTKVAVDDWRNAEIDGLDAQVTAVVENGKIKSFSLELTPEAQTKLAELAATATAGKKTKK